MGASFGLEVWCEDEAGPFRAVPQPGSSWQPDGHPARHRITITPVRGKPTRHLGVVEFDRDRVTIAYAADGQERPKSVDDAKGVTVYVFQRVPPPPRMEYRIIPVVTGKEEETEREVNRLAGEGFEVVFATSGSGSHLVLRRQKP